tara:strand:- start:33 stop:740 length:708 start_codon:yes stop_codon:yes gene_type:complete
MALPKLNDTPKYSVKIPSTQQTVRFRPFLVKEEKVLLLAMESDDTNDIMLAVLDTISACVADDIDVNKLPTYDVEYLFTQIRAKSVGETTTIGIECESCKEPNQITIDINSIKVEGLDQVKFNVDLAPNMQLELKHPSYNDIFNDPSINEEDLTETLFAMVRHCMKTLKTEDQIINLEEETVDSIDDFIGSMNTEQFESIREFVDNVPAMKYDAEFDCKCGHHNKKELRGIQSFF